MLTSFTTYYCFSSCYLRVIGQPATPLHTRRPHYKLHHVCLSVCLSLCFSVCCSIHPLRLFDTKQCDFPAI